ncbi:MAG TPA: hypothetical protein EYG21_06515 [Nitrospinaceae bacterium]|nr:hypothetical protein [Nitrospinaceae bacterium]
MSSDKFIKQRIKEIILSEKIADQSYSKKGMQVAHGMGISPQDYYAPGQSGFMKGTTSFKDAIKTAVGIVAPTAIMALKTISDLTTTAMSLGKRLFASVDSTFSGESAAHKYRMIAAQQQSTFIRSNAKAKERIANWSPTRGGTEDSPGTANKTYWLREQMLRSVMLENERTTSEMDMLAAVDDDLRTYISSVNHAMTAQTTDDLVRMGAAALSIDEPIIDTQAMIAASNSNISEFEIVQQRLLPFMKSTVLQSAIIAIEETRAQMAPMYRELDLDPTVIESIKSKYQSAIDQITVLQTGLNIQS